ncbi:VapD [Pseudomonas syringae group genomosp. 3]|uniref:VapD n=1 Tax=Pseudomonas syringae group genomosp. 3 TaxID=251701 RepID=UPI0007090090|nr:VapD [Pseudomonas syringae group genomosp. 3]
MSKYLITFDMNTNCLKNEYHGNNWNNAYYDIGKILKRHGFSNLQGSVYIGSEEVSEAHGTLAIQEVTATYEWFHSCVSNIKFYRLESDLDAQFIADGVNAARESFRGRVRALEESLRKAGLKEDQIQAVMLEQKFDFKEIGQG